MKPDVHSKNFNAKCEFVILSKIDKDGNFSLLHGKPLTLELFNTIPDITVAFSEDKRHNLFKYTMSKDFEFAKFGTNKLIINTSTDSICIQFTREAGKFW